MKLGYSIPNNQGVAAVADLVAMAVHAENLGYHSVWVSEHLFHSTYVAKRLGDRPYHDPLTVLAAIAGQTEVVRLGTSVLVIPWHHPARLGKTIASLDNLSNGRVDLGVGVAITQDEFENLGIDFKTRGRRADDTLAALRALWSEDVPQHDGPFYQFSGQRFEPKPMQSPLPVHIGGGSEAALKRVVAFGHGWHALGKSPNELGADLVRLRGLLTAAGRADEPIHVSIRCVVDIVDQPWNKPYTERRTLKGTSAEVRATIEAYAAAGVDEIVIDANSADLPHNREIMQRVMTLMD
jgi:probable F420-dependent oxidoreductase